MFGALPVLRFLCGIRQFPLQNMADKRFGQPTDDAARRVHRQKISGIAGKKSGQPLPRLFMACGTEDALLADNDRLSAYLDSIGLAHTYLKGPGGHNWPFWNQYIAIALEQFFRDNL